MQRMFNPPHPGELLREDEIPWDRIAFRSIAISLRHFFEDRRSGRFQLHTLSEGQQQAPDSPDDDTDDEDEKGAAGAPSGPGR